MTNNINFQSFLQDYAAVEIPILQRDYAQGRTASKSDALNEKGANFLAVLMDALQEDRPLELDFIYGSCETRNAQQPEQLTFLPLDGQQRLTTLWLLHWYVAQATQQMGDWAQALGKFTYATRTTARDFCQRLVTLRLDAAQLAQPAATLKGYLWFTAAYAYDPTIDAMVRMLDAIAKQFEERAETLALADAMKRLQQIQFRVFDIGHYGLSDELYIKMNGRGRALSSAENFKADLLGYLKQSPDFSVEEVRAVSKKCDHAWAEMAWGTKQNEGYDARYLRLFKRYLYNLWMEHHLDEKSDAVPEELEGIFTKEVYFNFAPFANLFAKSGVAAVKQMFAFFDFLAAHEWKAYREAFFAPWNDKKAQTDYPYMMDENVSMADRLTLFALSKYVENPHTAEVPSEHFAQWMRIVHHLLADPQLRTYAVQQNYLKAIKTLAEHAHEIEGYLKNIDVSSLGLSEGVATRLAHEQEKLRHLAAHPGHRAALLKLEKHDCLKGQVKFALGFEGDDEEFAALCEKAYELVKDDEYWSAKDLWPAVIAKCKAPIFILERHGCYDYFRHQENGSGVKWRLQDLLNRPHIAAAFREVVQAYLEHCRASQGTKVHFNTVSQEIRNAFSECPEGGEYHYHLVKTNVLTKCVWGRIYRREDFICLQEGWRVTNNQGYYRLEEEKLRLRHK